MKKFITLLFLGLSLSSFSAEIDRQTLDKLALDIDNICADTYCEGDFNWAHSNLKCDLENGYCTLDIDLIDQFYLGDIDLSKEEDREEYEARLDFERTITNRYDFLFLVIEEGYTRNVEYSKLCVIPNLFSVEDVMEGGSYSEKLYDGVLDCITTMEDDYYKLAESVDSIF